MFASLDGALFALVRDEPDVWVPLVARQDTERVALVFTERSLAQAHLSSLPQEQAGAWRLTACGRGDWRCKEELLLAARAVGASRVELDPDLRLRPEAALPLSRALDYVASYRRATACL